MRITLAMMLVAVTAVQAVAQDADSLYRIGRNALATGDYGRAASVFSSISTNFPKSTYASDAPYYEATARYKIGTTDELHTAARVLEPLLAKLSSGASTNPSSTPRPPARMDSRRWNESDVATLYARINGVLAQRGDRDAAERIKKAAQSGTPSCDQEDIQVKAEVLNALSRMNPAQATPRLRLVLDRKDECSASLRRNAVFILGQRNDAESANLLIAAAKSDPSQSVRGEAISTLSRIPGDAGFNALEDLLKHDQDEGIQRQIVSSLMRSDNAKARTSMRALISRKNAPLDLRIEAINSVSSDRATAEDAAYLRGQFASAESDNVKRAIIDAVSRIGGPENEQWLLSLARNKDESSEVRSVAIGRMMRANISIGELGKLYDAADSYNIRQQIINVLRSRKEPEASDKLVDIAKNGTDLKLRMQAINALTSRNDPRSQQLFIEILDGRRP